jgi:IclR family acetate operon transcriptional repressor
MFSRAEFKLMDAKLLIKDLETQESGEFPAPTVAKTMSVIEVVGQHALGLTQAEIVSQTGCSANLVFRVLNTLVSLGYMHRQDGDRRYILTNKLMEICRPRMVDKSIVVCSYQALQWLRDQSRETVQLVIESANKILVLEQLSGLEAVQVMGRVGMQVPMYSCAPGKVILAFSAPEVIEKYFSSVILKSYTSNTKATRKALEADFKTIKQQGFSEDWEEGIEGIRCVAAPILDAYQRPICAITLMAPSKRLPQRRFVELGLLCVEAANKARQELL